MSVLKVTKLLTVDKGNTMKDKLTKLFKKIVNTDCFDHAKSIVIDFLADNDLTKFEIMPQPYPKVVIWMGSKEVTIKSDDYRKIAALLASSEKIHAIKYLRMITGSGLKEARDAVYDYQNWPIRSETPY